MAATNGILSSLDITNLILNILLNRKIFHRFTTRLDALEEEREADYAVTRSVCTLWRQVADQTFVFRRNKRMNCALSKKQWNGVKFLHQKMPPQFKLKEMIFFGAAIRADDIEGLRIMFDLIDPTNFADKILAQAMCHSTELVQVSAMQVTRK